MKISAPIKYLFSHAQMPQALLVAGFAGLILVGALLLMLPWAHQAGEVGFVDALFTSTSAVCVTGLIVVDTPKAYTVFGQMVILTLIQMGGLGIMTFAALAYLMLGRRLSLASQAALHDSFFQRDLGVQFKQKFFQILRNTVIIEALGALAIFLTLLLWYGHPPAYALYSGVFHAVSAFCNAGFSIYSDNLMPLRDSAVVMAAVVLLIVLGGLGHMVLQEFWERFKNRVSRSPRPSGDGLPLQVSTHSRVVLSVTAALIASGTLGLLVLGLTSHETTWGMKISSALFQSVTARTAGFNTVDVALMPVSSLLLLILLMFIGGSPGSCAGGIKTTTFAISLSDLRAKIRGERQVRLFSRRVPDDTLVRAAILVRLAVLWNLIGVFLLLVTETGRPGIGMHDIIFEQISAFGTVGLSTGLTFKLSAIGKLWITATMFMGRLGPLTLALWVLPVKHVHVGYPEGRVMIG